MMKWGLFLLTLYASASWCQSEPSKSGSLTRFSSSSATDQQIQVLQDRVKQSPTNYAAYDELGSAFFQKARELSLIHI